MADDGLLVRMRKLRGSWAVYPYYNGDEVIREEYFSRDAPICVLLEKQGGNCWLSEIFLREDGEEILLDRMGYFGLDSYKQAYNFLCLFSRNIMKGVGLEDVVSDSGANLVNVAVE